MESIRTIHRVVQSSVSKPRVKGGSTTGEQPFFELLFWGLSFSGDLSRLYRVEDFTRRKVTKEAGVTSQEVNCYV